MTYKFIYKSFECLYIGYNFMHKDSKRNQFISYLLITIGLFLYAFAWTVFLIPREIVGGGISGISSIIYLMTDKAMPVGVSNLIFNSILVLIALKVLGAKFGINTIYGIVISSGFFILLQQVIKIQDIIDATQFDPFMCAVIGGGLSGAGIGLAFIKGGNSGGTDIIALIVTKYYNVSPGRVIMLLDIFIIGSSYMISESIEKVVYGYIQTGVMTYALDLVIEGAKQSYQIMVFSKHAQEIADKIGSEIGRGITLLNAHGWYTKSEQKVVLVIARKVDREPIMEIVNEIDKNAFISVSKVQGVYGQNFEKLKL